MCVAVAEPADCSRADGEGRKAVRRGATEAWSRTKPSTARRARGAPLFRLVEPGGRIGHRDTEVKTATYLTVKIPFIPAMKWAGKLQM